MQARRVGAVLQVSIPASMTREEEAHWVKEMVARATRRSAAGEVDLRARAAQLGRLLDLPRPAAIRWVDNQNGRWGSCTPATGTVRISSRVAEMPGFVVDYVIVHELAHLSNPSHDADFWAAVGRYGLAERARGYLMAKGIDDEADRDPGDDDDDRPGHRGQ